MTFPTIQVLLNGKILQTVPLNKGAISIGRMRENDIVIDNLAVSRFHAKIFLEKNEVILEDQASENGCLVNGQRITKVTITPDDEIVIGKHQLKLLSETSPEILSSLPALSSKNPSTPWDASSTYVVDAATQEKMLKRIVTPSPAPSLPMATLQLQFNGITEQVIPWDQPTLSVGRALDCDIVLDNPQISRRHALLVKQGEHFFVEDLDTGNGTWVNGKRKKKETLKNNDMITIGDYQITFSIKNENPLPAPGEINTAEITKIPQEPSVDVHPHEMTGKIILPMPEKPAETVTVKPTTLVFEIELAVQDLSPALQQELREKLEHEIPLRISLKLKE